MFLTGPFFILSLLRDFLDVSKIFYLDCGLIYLDQEKAFDHVKHNYLWKTLEFIGFCQNFVNMIKVLGPYHTPAAIRHKTCLPRFVAIFRTPQP